MSNERDELADVIGAVTDTWDEPLDSVHDIPQIVNAILAAGYRKPRTVTTAAELNALPDGSVVKTLIAGEPTGRTWGKVEGAWWGVALECPDSPVLPATVLHEATR